MAFFFGTLTEHLQEPEYLHVLLNPLPVYGLFMGTLGLMFGFAFRSRPARVLAMSLILLASASAWPVYHYGEAGYDRVLSLSDRDGELWLKEHVHRAEKFIPVFFVLAALAAVALLVPFKWPRSERPLSAATLCLAILALLAGGWIAYAGGRVRHKEFRDGPPAGAKAAALDGPTNPVRLSPPSRSRRFA
jgi:hypothetical protein